MGERESGAVAEYIMVKSGRKEKLGESLRSNREVKRRM